jgi:serine/threonine protein kinase
MSGSSEPTFKHGRWISAYSWENAPTQQFRSGNQAISISTVRKQKQKRGTPVKLYVCKWYKTAGVGLTGIDGDKYIFQEWKTFRSLQHPNIVAYEDFSYDPNGARVAKLYMEYCPGGDLRLFQNAGSQDNRLGVDEGLQILEQLAQALLYIHHGISKTADRLQLARPADSEPALSHDGKASEWNSILHRDVKPENGAFTFNVASSPLIIC